MAAGVISGLGSEQLLELRVGVCAGLRHRRRWRWPGGRMRRVGLASPRGEGVVAGAVLSLQGRDGAGESRVAAAGVKAGDRPTGRQIWF